MSRDMRNKATQLLLVVAIASSACLTACTGGQTPEATTLSSTTSQARTPISATNPLREPANGERFYKDFTGDKWANISAAAYGTAVCNALDKGEDPKSVVNWVLDNLRTVPTTSFMGWKLLDAQYIVGASADNFCPEYYGKIDFQ